MILSVIGNLLVIFHVSVIAFYFHMIKAIQVDCYFKRNNFNQNIDVGNTCVSNQFQSNWV